MRITVVIVLALSCTLFASGCATQSLLKGKEEKGFDRIDGCKAAYSTSNGNLQLYVDGWLSGSGFGRHVLSLPLTKILAGRQNCLSTNSTEKAVHIQGGDWITLSRSTVQYGWPEDRLPRPDRRLKALSVSGFPQVQKDLASTLNGLVPVEGAAETVYFYREPYAIETTPENCFFVYVSEATVEKNRHYLVITLAPTTVKALPKALLPLAVAIDAATTSLLLGATPVVLPSAIGFAEMLNKAKD